MQPRPTNHEDQEDAVLGSLVAQVVAAGLEAVLIENPDRLPVEERRVRVLTTDGLIEIDEALWSVDVMSVATPADLYIVPEMLEDRLAPIAQQFGAVVILSGALPARSSVDAVVEAVRSAMVKESIGFWEPSPKFRAAWRPLGADESARVEALVWLDGSALLSDQLEVAIKEPLARKATVQARPARTAGCSTAVALDQVGHAGMKAGTQWLAQRPETFCVAVKNVLASLPEHFLDAVLLHDQDGGWHLLTGHFPGLPHRG